jgi:hypothetical protein
MLFYQRNLVLISLSEQAFEQYSIDIYKYIHSISRFLQTKLFAAHTLRSYIPDTEGSFEYLWVLSPRHNHGDVLLRCRLVPE